MRKIFIGGLPFNCSRDAIYVYFLKYGAIQDAVLMCDPETKHPRGFGFVTFVKEESVHAAMLSRPHTLLGKMVSSVSLSPSLSVSVSLLFLFQVDVKRAVAKAQLQAALPPPDFHYSISPGAKIIITSIKDVQNRPADWNYSMIKLVHEYFIQFGNLEQIERKKNGEMFIIYEKKKAAEDCLEFNGGRHCYNGLTITVRAAGEEGDSEADDESS